MTDRAVSGRDVAKRAVSSPVPPQFRTRDAEGVVGQRPPPGSDGTVTLMFSDIEGSTRINDQLGDEQWTVILEAHNSAIEQAVRSSGGRVIKMTGDGYTFLMTPSGVAVITPRWWAGSLSPSGSPAWRNRETGRCWSHQTL